MKILDLAEKQLNNETLPKHIRYNNEDLYFDGVSYCDKQGNNDLLDILARENSAITHLYDEVEIIDEDKKIEKIDYIHPDIACSYNESEILLRVEANKDKINELIDEVNKLKGGIRMMKKAPKVLTRMRLSCCWGDNLNVEELIEIVDYINDLERYCKKQKEVIDKAICYVQENTRWELRTSNLLDILKGGDK